MPFKKKGKYYYSPSGKKFTSKQVKLYYATKGFKEGDNNMPKGKGTYGSKKGRPKKKRKELLKKVTKSANKTKFGTHNKGGWIGKSGSNTSTATQEAKKKKKDWLKKKVKKGASASKTAKRGKTGKKSISPIKKPQLPLKKNGVKKEEPVKKVNGNKNGKVVPKKKVKEGMGKKKRIYQGMIHKNDPTNHGGALNGNKKKKKKKKKK